MIKKVIVLDDRLVKEITSKLEHGEYELLQHKEERETEKFNNGFFHETIVIGAKKEEVIVKIGKYKVTIEKG